MTSLVTGLITYHLEWAHHALVTVWRQFNEVFQAPRANSTAAAELAPETPKADADPLPPPCEPLAVKPALARQVAAEPAAGAAEAAEAAGSLEKAAEDGPWDRGQ